MSTPDTPQNAHEPNAAQTSASDEAVHRPEPREAQDVAPAIAAEPRRAAPPPAASGDDDDGPQPGNMAPRADGGDDEDDDGPAPGNERSPEGGASDSPGQATEGGAAGATGGGAPGTGKKRRRRRKGKGPRPEGAVAADGSSEAPAQGEGAPTGEAAAQGEGAPGEPGGGKPREGKRRRERGPRPPHDGRERPAFNVGEQVFGRILDINDDAVLIDLAGKGLALFDRMEMDIVDEPATPAEAREHAAAEAAAEEREEGGAPRAVDAASSESAAPAADAPAPADAPAADAPSKAEVIGAVVEAVATAVVEAAKEAVTSTLAADAPDATKAGDETSETAAAPAEGEAPAAEGEAAAPAAAAPKEPQAPLPPIVLEPGANFVGYIHNDGGRGGLVVVTRHPKRASKIKPVVSQAFKDRTTVMGLVTGVIKGGAEVDVQGLRAFAPGSHMDIRPGADLTPLLARRLEFYVTQYAKRGRDVVLTRKPFLEAEAKANRDAALAKLTPGSVVEGTVRSVVQFGAFIDVGGVEGLVPLAEMSHNRSDGPHDVFKVGETVPVKILKIDERGKIWLSRRATTPDPWAAAAKKYNVGSKHQGKVVRLQPFGAFIELESGIDGLIHVADLWAVGGGTGSSSSSSSTGSTGPKRIEHPSEVVKVGDMIDVVVASNDPSSHKISLHPAPTGEAANETPQRVALHRPVKVVVVAAEATGLQVRVLGATGRHARGYITGAATGTPRGTELRRLFPPGKELEAKVIEMDPKRAEIKLSIKALAEETERSAYQQYRQQVSRDAKFTFADLIAKKQPQK